MNSNSGTKAPVKRKSLPHAASIWRANWDSRGLRPRTRAFYESTLKAIAEWSEAEGHPTFGRALDRKRLKSLLKSFDNRESMRAGVRTTLSSLIDVARTEGWIEGNPLEDVTLRRLKRTRDVGEWTRADVADYVNAALKQGWAGGAALLTAMWETSADATDVCAWTRAENFIDDQIEPRVLFRRGKTGELRDIPISHELAAMWRTCDAVLVTDPDGRPYERDCRKADSRRGHDLSQLRNAAVAGGARRLLFDHLRHSAATDAVERGASLEETTALTQHKSARVLERVYVQRNRARARIVQRARGIIRDEQVA